MGEMSMGAIVNVDAWQGWPKVEPAWPNEKRYKKKYNNLLVELSEAAEKAATDDIALLDWLMNKATGIMAAAYQNAKEIHGDDDTTL